VNSSLNFASLQPPASSYAFLTELTTAYNDCSTDSLCIVNTTYDEKIS